MGTLIIRQITRSFSDSSVMTAATKRQISMVLFATLLATQALASEQKCSEERCDKPRYGTETLCECHFRLPKRAICSRCNHPQPDEGNSYTPYGEGYDGRGEGRIPRELECPGCKDPDYPFECTGKDNSDPERERPCEQCHGELVIHPRDDKRKPVRDTCSTTRLPEAICDFIVDLLPCEECEGSGANGDWRLYNDSDLCETRSWANFSILCRCGKPSYASGQCCGCWWYENRRRL